jgi:predicted acyltransferase
MRRVGTVSEGAGFPATKAHCAAGLFLAGLVSMAAGLLWNVWFPINKNLWTSSYVLFAAGCSLVGLATCYWLIDVRRLHETRVGGWLTWPWLVYGSNAIVAFTVSVVLVKTLLFIKISSVLGPNGKPITAWGWIYNNIFARGHSTELTSLAFGLWFVLMCFIPNWILWRRKIFVKI